MLHPKSFGGNPQEGIPTKTLGMKKKVEEYCEDQLIKTYFCIIDLYFCFAFGINHDGNAFYQVFVFLMFYDFFNANDQC